MLRVMQISLGTTVCNTYICIYNGGGVKMQVLMVLMAAAVRSLAALAGRGHNGWAAIS